MSACNNRHYDPAANIVTPTSVVEEKVRGQLEEEQATPYKVTKGQREQAVRSTGHGSVSNSNDMAVDLCTRPGPSSANSEDDVFPDTDTDSFDRNYTVSAALKRPNDKVNHDNGPRQAEDFSMKISVQHILSKYLTISVRGQTLILNCNYKRNLPCINSVKESYVTEYTLPKHVNMDKLSCVRTLNGILHVTGPCAVCR